MSWFCRSAVLVFLSILAEVANAGAQVRFSRACEPAETLVLSGVGDILPHTALQKQSYASSEGFQTLWRNALPWLDVADISYGNLEGPAAYRVAAGGRDVAQDPGQVYDGVVYSGSNMMFNYHPRIITDLAASGFDILSTANNHSMDRSSLGMDRTIEAFERADLPYVGTRRTEDRQSPWHRKLHKKGWTVAFIACSEMTNGLPDRYGQVLLCYRDANTIVREIQALRAEGGVDAIVVTPHWGVEYQYQPNAMQMKTGRQFLEAGADVILGNHPHVPQPIEKYKTRDGRETLIAYSLGNFVSNQSRRLGQRLTAVLYVGLSKRRGERAWVNGISYLPLWMERGPFNLSPLETTKQAPKQEAYSLLHGLFDASRELRVSDRVGTQLECR